MSDSPSADSAANSADTEQSRAFSTNGEAGSYRELLAIAIPMVISSGVQSLMHIVSRVFLRWSSSEAMAAALPASILFWTCLSLPHGLVAYTGTMVAQYNGVGRSDRSAASVWQGIYLSILFGCVLMVCSLLASPFFRWIAHGSQVENDEIIYFSTLCLGGIPALLQVALSCSFSGRGKTRIVMAVNIICVAVNIALDYCLIFGKFNCPKLGIQGAAVSMILAEITAVSLFFAALMIDRSFPFWRNWKPDFKLCQRILWFAIPSGFLMFVDAAAFTTFMMMIGKLGPKELEATNIAFNLNTLAFVPVIGMGISVSILVGNRMGEGKPELAAKSARRGFVVAGTYMLLCGLIYVTCPNLLLMPYEAGITSAESSTGSPLGEVHDIVSILLRFIAIYSFFDAMAIVFGNAIRSAGDVFFSVAFTLACAAFLLVTPTWLAWQYLGGSLIRSWTFCAIYVVVLGLGFWFRFEHGRWKSLRVIEFAPQLDEAN